MPQLVIYPTESGVAVFSPYNSELAIEDLAQSVVPAGAPYLIIDSSDLPTDRTFRNAWTADFSNPDGYSMGPEAWYALRPPLPPGSGADNEN